MNIFKQIFDFWLNKMYWANLFDRKLTCSQHHNSINPCVWKKKRKWNRRSMRENRKALHYTFFEFNILLYILYISSKHTHTHAHTCTNNHWWLNPNLYFRSIHVTGRSKQLTYHKTYLQSRVPKKIVSSSSIVCRYCWFSNNAFLFFVKLLHKKKQ